MQNHRRPSIARATNSRRLIYWSLRLIACVITLASLPEHFAAERFVPTGGILNYSTIQAAITASQAGDVVRVQPGLYRESITFQKADIVLTSMDPNDSNVVQTTIIEGNGKQSVVTFGTGQTTNTVFTGFTVRGGGGQLGGGIYCDSCSPSIIGNVIEENRTSVPSTNSLSQGGGIFCLFANARIARNIIRENSAYMGAGIATFSGTPLIRDNWIYNNTGREPGLFPGGGGAGAYLGDRGRFLNNTLVNNMPDCLFVASTDVIANNIIAQFINATGTVAQVTGALSSFQYNDVWKPGGDEIPFYENSVRTNLVGRNGNVSVDPSFLDATHFNWRLSALSPCINAGDLLGLRSAGELDFDGASRIYGFRVDMGANESRVATDFLPVAEAGPDRTVYWNPSEALILDGSGSKDAEESPLDFAWTQTAGPPVTLLTTNSQAVFTPAGLGNYEFQLVVNDGERESQPATVRLAVTNLPPIAGAGLGQSLAEVPEEVMLDGSHSMDPQDQPLTYQWRQTGGPAVSLSSSMSSTVAFRPSGPGAYAFELTVSNAFNADRDHVAFYLGHVPPVADAGPTRYAGRAPITLDGSGSFAPNSSTLPEYTWRQVSGPAVTLLDANTAKPTVRGFVQTTNVQELTFELVVWAEGFASAPSLAKIIVVPSWNNSTVSQVNPPFNTNRPTIFAFSGGDCDSGSSMSVPSSWLAAANVFTGSFTRDSASPSYDPTYLGYGEQLIVALSTAAPNYAQPIQTIGYSTGCMPACDVAERFNVRYKDPHFYVNRITLLDSGCVDFRYDQNISDLSSNRMPGKMFWIDNYYAIAGHFRKGILNVEFLIPPADHSTPNSWYFPSWNIATPYRSTNFNSGIFAGAFFSLVGPGKNFQLETAQSEYYFGWGRPVTASFPVKSLVQVTPFLNPGRFPGVVELVGPTNGALAIPQTTTFSCQPVLNAIKYQILVGPDSHQVNQIAWEGTAPPSQPLAHLPFPRTWWTIRAADIYGTTSWADSRSVLRDTDGDGLSDEAETATYHTDPYDADTDRDGHPDEEEILAGSDPFKAEPGLRLWCRRLPLNQLQFSWFSDPDASYSLEFSPSLTIPAWHNVEPSTTLSVGRLLQQTISAPTEGIGFYRIRTLKGL